MTPPKLLGRIQGHDISLMPSGRVLYWAKMAIDCDGSGGNPDNDPYFQPDTSLHHNGEALNAYKVPFIAVPPAIILGVEPIVLGCQCYVSYGDRLVAAVVGDVGPKTKLGEGSPALASLLGINPNPNHGGVDAGVHYDIRPGVPAVVDGIIYDLQPYRRARRVGQKPT